jgi:polysaccharide biosynthesis protein PslG
MSRSSTVKRAGRIAALVVTTGLVAPALTLSVATPASAAPLATAATAVANYDSAVLADSPQYYYPLNETSGPVSDATGHEADSTTNTAQLNTPGAPGTAATFDGTSQRITVPYKADMKLTGSFSIEMWAKLPAAPQTSGYPTLFSRGTGNPGHYGAVVWAGSDAAHLLNFKRNGKNVPSARGLKTTAYRHVVFTWDAAAQRYTWYIDGTLDIGGVMPAIAGTDVETAPLTIGALQDYLSTPVHSFGKASIDGLAVYKSVLPATRVAAHYSAAAVAPPVAAPVVKQVGGIAVGDLQPWNTKRATDFAAWRGANASYIRTDIGWKYLQPTPTTWSWSLYDGVLTDMQANGLKYLAILHTVPGWANGNAGEAAPPTNLALETEYCYQTVKHFLPRGVKDYEIGNEVNYVHPGWVPTGANYATKFLIPCVSGARRAAAELGLPVNLMFGSMAPGGGVGGQEPLSFLADAYAAGARGQTDSIAFHPYGGLNPSVEPNMTSMPTRIRQVMQANGDGTNTMWATEYGLPTAGPNSWSEQVQAEWINDAYTAWSAHPFSGPMIWYAGRDTGTSTTDREQHFGILRADGTQKPAYAVLQNQLTR